MNKVIDLSELKNAEVFGATADEIPKVGVLAKAIAAGGRYDSRTKKLKLRVCLQFTPHGDGDVALEVWPLQIRNLLADPKNKTTLGLNFIGPLGTRPAPPAGWTVSLPLNWPRLDKAFRPDSGSAIREVNGLWEKALMTFENELDDQRAGLWNALGKQLKNSASGGRWSTDLDPNGKEAKGKEHVVKNILVNEQRNQAAHLEVMRALETIASMTGRRVADERDILKKSAMDMDTVRNLSVSAGDLLKKGNLNVVKLGEAEGKALLADARKKELDRLENEWAKDAKSAAKAKFDEAKAELGAGTSKHQPINAASSAKQACDCDSLLDLCAGMKPALDSHAYTTWRNPSADPSGTGKNDLPDPGSRIADSDLDAKKDHVAQRFYNIQSTPALSRLFLLTLDAEFEIEEGLEIPPSGFYSLTVSSPWFHTHTSKISTLALLDSPLDQPDGAKATSEVPVSFWPAQRREIQDGTAFVIDQRHGIQLIGGMENGVPRYDLTSLDVRSATEATYEKSRKRAAIDRGQLDVTGEGGEAELPTAERDTLVSAGLTLLDGDRLGFVSRRLAARDVQNNSSEGKPVLLDADDLLAGYAIDIAVGTKKPDGTVEANWRPLMNRTVEFGQQGSTVRRVLNDLAGSPHSDKRQPIDSALLAPNLKFAPPPDSKPAEMAAAADGTAKPVNAIAEQIVATWDGGPMGVECAGAKEDKVNPGDLPFDQAVNLPQGTDASALVPLLRFGRAYRIGIRAMFQGGVGPTLSEAEAVYNTQADAAYPPLDGGRLTAKAFKRHLRHDRMGPPQVLLPASRAFTNENFMGFETAKHAIVRSLRDAEDGDRPSAELETPVRTARYIVPPGVPQDLAKIHGMFDTRDTAAGGLRNVAAVDPDGHFPVAVNVMAKGLNAEPIIVSRRMVEKADGPSEGVFATASKLGGTSTDSVRYFPDPQARLYVIAARHAGTAAYVPEHRLSVLATESGPAGLKLIPLRLAVERATGAASSKPLLEDGHTRSVDELPPPPTSSVRSGAVMVHQVAVNLRPGDDFELDVWCVPSADDLARNCAVVEMIAALGLRKEVCLPKPDTDPALLLDAFWKGLSKLFSGNAELTEKLNLLKAYYPETEWRPMTGPGGLVVPDKEAVSRVAFLVHSFMLTQPLTEISSVATLRVTHAINAPLLAPEIPACNDVSGKDGRRPLIARRLKRKAMDDLALSEANTRYDGFFGAAVPGERNYPHEAANDVALAGTIAIDTDSSSAFRVHAESVFPRSPLFDDPARRRSAIDRRQGNWPVQTLRERNPDDAFKPVRNGKLVDYLLPTSALYGFHVRADGKVDLPRTKVTLLSVDRLPTSHQASEGKTPEGREHIELEQLYGIVDASGEYKLPAGQAAVPLLNSGNPVPPALKGAQVKLEHAFPDGKARQLLVTVESISRHAHLMAQVPHRDQSGRLVSALPLPDQFDSITTAQAACVWLQATVRPSKPETRSALPVFRWEQAATDLKASERKVLWQQCYTRKSAVRLRLRRGWFSSGEGERLGIVLWPPNLFSAKTVDLAKDEVSYEEPWGTDKTTARIVRLSEFTDEDLGPGGRFISRWGGDPIRQSSGGITGNFIPPGQFSDYVQDGGEEPILAEAVEMPITRVAAGGEAKQDGTEATVDFLTVSLLAYEPRFDVDSEYWYADVNIKLGDAPDPFVRLGLVRYQAHAPKYLQLSEPVVEWAQLLPDRKIDVRLLELEQKYVVEVEVKGLASTGAKVAAAELKSFNKAYQYPLIRMRLVAERGPPEVMEREVIEECFVDCLDPEQYHMDNGHSVWTRKFQAVGAEQIGDAKLFVTVEEVEVRLRATLEDEPAPLLLGGQDSLKNYTESGPRFIARVDLPDELPVLKTQARDK